MLVPLKYRLMIVLYLRTVNATCRCRIFFVVVEFSSCIEHLWVKYEVIRSAAKLTGSYPREIALSVPAQIRSTLGW